MSENVVEVRYVTVEPKRKTNHILHLLLSVITLGLWLPVWLACSTSTQARNGERKPGNVFLNLLLSVLTLGLWLPIWLGCSLSTQTRDGLDKPSHMKNFAILAVLIVVALVFARP